MNLFSPFVCTRPGDWVTFLQTQHWAASLRYPRVKYTHTNTPHFGLFRKIFEIFSQVFQRSSPRLTSGRSKNRSCQISSARVPPHSHSERSGTHFYIFYYFKFYFLSLNTQQKLNLIRFCLWNNLILPFERYYFTTFIYFVIA